MKRSFVRIVWGDFLDENNPLLPDYEKQFGFKFDPLNKILIRRFKIDIDIAKCLKNEFQIPFVVYTFGEKNHKQLLEMGIESRLIHKDPYKYHPIKGIYKHKIDAHQYMMNDFDEIVFLDWDTYLIKPLPNDFWDVLNKKEIFQAVLGKYRTARINYRPDHKSNQLIPMGALVYMRDKTIPERLMKFNTGSNSWSCEPAFAQLTDEIMGGWNNLSEGIDKYWNLFEPECYVNKRSAYKFSKKYIKTNVCFHNGWPPAIKQIAEN